LRQILKADQKMLAFLTQKGQIFPVRAIFFRLRAKSIQGWILPAEVASRAKKKI
jgi:hypothetical protein